MHGRPEGPRPPGPPPVRGGPRRPVHRGRRAGRHRQGLRARAVLRQGHRRHPRRRHQDHLHRGDRDRPLRRAGGPLRRHLRPGQGRLRDPGRGRLPAGDRVLRVPPRAEAHRGPDVRRRPGEDALVGLRDRRVGRLRLRPADHHRRHQGRDEEDPRRDPGRHLRQRLDRGVQRRPAQVQRVQEGRREPPAGDDGPQAAQADELGRRGGVSLPGASLRTRSDRHLVRTLYEATPPSG
ncbi:hypothetical protein SCOCK_130146 [Actinacidiphila cocklensis]|uniref:Uncharacterized protein n=1 Tax=Actinacidiphila cocklensis TaxID=887465 RepID=A0A9W4E2Z3_9ACTN|nr:hypothetical protein SCOCK_130146 [Actinacidiphila cocklensis]